MCSHTSDGGVETIFISIFNESNRSGKIMTLLKHETGKEGKTYIKLFPLALTAVMVDSWYYDWIDSSNVYKHSITLKSDGELWRFTLEMFGSYAVWNLPPLIHLSNDFSEIIPDYLYKHLRVPTPNINAIAVIIWESIAVPTCTVNVVWVWSMSIYLNESYFA